MPPQRSRDLAKPPAPLRAPARLDTLVRVETPEGVDLELHAAGAAPRAVAWGLDLALRGVIIIVVSIALTVFGAFGGAILLVVVFALEWGYPVAFEVLRQGRTPGKAALGLQVLRRDGTPVDFAASALRNLLRAADFLPVLYGFGLVAMLSDRHFRRLGDLVAGTLVVHTPRAVRGSIPDGVAPRPPAVHLLHEEQQALIALAQRHATLSTPRIDELAGIVAPLLAAQGTAETAGARAAPVFGVAAWLLGRRAAHDPALREDEEGRRGA